MSDDSRIIDHAKQSGERKLMSGWGVKKWAENPGTSKKEALDRLMALGYVELAYEEVSVTTYRHTPKAEVLFAQLCVGISGG